MNALSGSLMTNGTTGRWGNAWFREQKKTVGEAEAEKNRGRVCHSRHAEVGQLVNSCTVSLIWISLVPKSNNKLFLVLLVAVYLLLLIVAVFCVDDDFCYVYCCSMILAACCSFFLCCYLFLSSRYYHLHCCRSLVIACCIFHCFPVFV